jgi:hypothetical protein
LNKEKVKSKKAKSRVVKVEWALPGNPIPCGRSWLMMTADWLKLARFIHARFQPGDQAALDRFLTVSTVSYFSPTKENH